MKLLLLPVSFFEFILIVEEMMVCASELLWRAFCSYYMMKWIQQIKDIVSTGNIKATESGRNMKGNWFLRPFKIIWYTIKGIREHEVMLRSAALTIYTVMSLVPIAALIFGILKGFGFEKYLIEYLYSTFSEYSRLLDNLMVFVYRTLERTQGGVIAAVGVIILLWSVIKVFGNIEDAFNEIWEVRKSRTLTRKFSDYIALVFVTPILLVASISLGTYITNFLSFLESWFVSILLGLASLVLIWILFAFVYWLMPNTRVKFKGALIAGAIAGTAFYFFSLIYFSVQSGVSSYNAIYGTFAAIPLFLAWMMYSWEIVLVGSELSFAYQNTGRYEQEIMAANMDLEHKRKVLLATMLSIAKSYLTDKGGISSESVASNLNMPIRIIRDMIYHLLEAKLVVPIQNHKYNAANLYVPARDIHTIKVSDVLDCMERNESDIDFSEMPQMKEVDKLLNEMRVRAYDPQLDLYLTDLISNNN